MHYLLLAGLFLSMTSTAETLSFEARARQDFERLSKEIKTAEDFLSKSRSYTSNEAEKLEVLLERQKLLATMEAKREETKAKLLKEIQSARGKIKFPQTVFSRRSKFYNCLQNLLEKSGYINAHECQRVTAINLDNDGEAEIKRWEKTLGVSSQNAKRELIELKQKIGRADNELSQGLALQERVQRDLLVQRKYLEEAKLSVEDYAKLDKRPEFRKCRPNLPTLNLEAPGGPFEGIPRDNQDGLGTCYANAGKNLLIGLSGGEIQPSYLDMALNYKKVQKEDFVEGLDGGTSCETLEKIKESGYCPQKYATLESGEANPVFEGLMGKSKKNSFWAQAGTISVLRNFLQGRNDLLKKNPNLDADILKKAGWIVGQMKKNPRIKIPLPVARIDIPGIWSLNYLQEQKQAKFGVGREMFVEEYRDSYRKFYPKLLKGLLQGKTPAQVADIYRIELAPFFKKYEVDKKTVDEWLRVFKIEAAEDYKDPKYKQSLKDSLNFLKALAGKEGEKDDAFIDYCTKDLGADIDFLKKLQPLMEKLRSFEVDPNILVRDGEFKDSAELMQLAVAPACLHPENRRPIPFEISCTEGYMTIRKIKTSERPVEEQLDMFRDRVVIHLLEGRALGNMYKTSGGGHINSIVGLRFNPEKNHCELLIRESQNGESAWWPEKEIFEQIHGLTEVRKK